MAVTVAKIWSNPPVRNRIMPLCQPKSIEFKDRNHRREAIELDQFTRRLGDGDYAALAGVCLDDAEVTVSFEYDLTGTQFPVGIRVRVADWFSTHLFFQRPNVTLHSIYVQEDRRGRGVAREVIFHQAEAAASFGFTSINAKAIRDNQHDGYSAAARWGFNAPLDQRVKELLAEPLKDATCLNDLMLTKGGQEFWDDAGGTVEVKFDLDRSSASWRILGRP